MFLIEITKIDTKREENESTVYDSHSYEHTPSLAHEEWLKLILGDRFHPDAGLSAKSPIKLRLRVISTVHRRN